MYCLVYIKRLKKREKSAGHSSQRWFPGKGGDTRNDLEMSYFSTDDFALSLFIISYTHSVLFLMCVLYFTGVYKNNTKGVWGSQSTARLLCSLT